ncbi:acyl carrier protein [Robertmurraya yapensis]|uniref:Acyl carrier protein n=1 Tax=Bacillus yapensis TaxID=2492960 RepID=A0A431WL54_9BACI|nr:phosphopantetheine-binding protein [Bacillus yapensis]RTR36163.1 acyl carrier protein [Bacillus yapensis]TKT05666.1 acyl carrier protein [Bacillus yapensis]
MSFEEFRQVIADISKVPLEKIHKDASFRDELDVDSLQMVNLIVELTARFNLGSFNLQSDKDLETVGALYQLMTMEES